MIEYLNVDGIINCDFLLFNNCHYLIEESIAIFTCWIMTLNSIHAFKIK